MFKVRCVRFFPQCVQAATACRLQACRSSCDDLPKPKCSRANIKQGAAARAVKCGKPLTNNSVWLQVKTAAQHKCAVSFLESWTCSLCLITFGLFAGSDSPTGANKASGCWQDVTRRDGQDYMSSREESQLAFLSWYRQLLPTASPEAARDAPVTSEGQQL